MKRAFVTGCTGQDGALLAKLLIEKGYQVFGLKRPTSSPTSWRFEELGLVDNPRLVLCSGDLTDQGSIERALDQAQPHEVYNLGAQSFVGESWDAACSTFDITGAGAVKLFDAVRNTCKHAKVYQASSSEMFGGANRHDLLSEESSFDPQSPYGVAKVAAHHMANVYRVSHDMFIACGILFNHESEWRGDQFVTRKVTKAAAEISLGLRDKLELGNLDAVRDWGYAPDYVEAMWMMLQHDEPDDFVCATGQTYSIEDLCCFAFEHVDISNWAKHVVITEDRPADVKHLRGNARKLTETLGWFPSIEFMKMVERMVDKDVERLSRA